MRLVPRLQGADQDGGFGFGGIGIGHGYLLVLPSGYQARLDQRRSIDLPKPQTNLPDWSALIPVLPAGGPRREALQVELWRLIETRVLLPGQKLPPSRELAQRLKLARGAVVAAYEQLAADGFVDARLGAGTYVAALVPEHAVPRSAPLAQLKTAPAPPAPGKLGSGTTDDNDAARSAGPVSRGAHASSAGVLALW
jgi:hypothetical protein